MTEITIPRRFRGPDGSGNGGWSAGTVAELVPGPAADRVVEVTLRTPPPLDRALRVAEFDEVTTALDGDLVVVTARAVDPPGPVVVAPVDLTTARRAAVHFAGNRRHPFPGCFTCGTARDEGDGLRIFPGPVDDDAGRPRVAATWTPHPSQHGADPAQTSVPITWAALDCPGAWAVDLTTRTVVLGRITTRLLRLPRIGDEHVVVGSALANDGRKWHTATTLYDADGDLVATAQHVWFEVDPAAFAPDRG